MTNAIPVFCGKLRKNSIAASNPPADPPIPTIGQAGDDFCFSPAPSGPNCGLTLREADRRGAPTFFVLRFAGMALFMIRGFSGPQPPVHCSPNSLKCLDATFRMATCWRLTL